MKLSEKQLIVQKHRQCTSPVFDALEANEIDARFVRSGENPANAMTAAEDRDRFARSVDVMTGRPPEGPARDVRPSERAA